MDESEINSDVGPVPELEWVPVEAIEVDNNYQRELRLPLVRKILRRFSWDKFGAVVLAKKPGGRFMVVEGQHRTEAARLHPLVNRVPAVVFDFSGIEGEAEAFIAINKDRQSVTPLERHWAAVTAGDAMAKRLQDVVQRAECEIAPAMGILRPHMTNAVAALERACVRYGDEATVRALKIIRAAWPKDSKALRGILITAMASLVRINPTFGDNAIAEALAPHSFQELTASVEAIRKTAGGGSHLLMMRTIADICNKGRSKRFLYYQSTEAVE